jgi:rhomboid protease GluP
MRFLTKFEHPIFQPPGGMVQLILVVNLVFYAVCFAQSETHNIPPDVLLRYGAMSVDAIEQHEFWRMTAYGFLHTSLPHLAADMFLLVLWGGHLEKRVGSLYFAFIYVSGLLAGAIVSKFTADNAYVLVGASGALSAVFGALIYLRLLGKFDLPWEYFAISVGLVVALIAVHGRIDWGAHLRGLAAGMICCGCLDLIERGLGLLLRCKFPEFVKVNAFVAFAVLAAYSRNDPLVDFSQWGVWVGPLAFALAALVVFKLLDLTLSMRKGLAIVVLVFALTNAGLILLLRGMFTWALASLCAGQPGTTLAITAGACANPDITINVTAASLFVVTMLAYWSPFSRGVADLGFVGNTLRTDRRRYPGL